MNWQHASESPGRRAALRAVVPLMNLDAFIEAFDIKAGDPMYLPPEERVSDRLRDNPRIWRPPLPGCCAGRSRGRALRAWYPAGASDRRVRAAGRRRSWRLGLEQPS